MKYAIDINQAIGVIRPVFRGSEMAKRKAERFNAEYAESRAQRSQRNLTAKTPASKEKAGGRFNVNCEEPARRRR